MYLVLIYSNANEQALNPMKNEDSQISVFKILLSFVSFIKKYKKAKTIENISEEPIHQPVCKGLFIDRFIV